MLPVVMTKKTNKQQQQKKNPRTTRTTNIRSDRIRNEGGQALSMEKNVHEFGCKRKDRGRG